MFTAVNSVPSKPQYTIVLVCTPEALPDCDSMCTVMQLRQKLRSYCCMWFLLPDKNYHLILFAGWRGYED